MIWIDWDSLLDLKWVKIIHEIEKHVMRLGTEI